jgi:glycosyltransferase involved in cell wall biosynthesis
MVKLAINGLPLLNPTVGVGVYTLRLIRGLVKSRRLPFVVLLPRSAEKAAAFIPSEAIVWVSGRAPFRQVILQNLYWMHRIAAVATREYPQAVFHSPGPFWSLLRPPHTVVTLHDCLYHYFPRYLGKWWVRKWMAYATERYAARADLVLTDSHCSARDLHRLAGVPESKIRVLYLWVEERFNRTEAQPKVSAMREHYQLPPRFFLYLGGYDYRKNVEMLLQAYARAREAGPLPPLVLAGKIPRDLSQPVCDVYGAMQRAGLEEGVQVFLPGLIADEDLPTLYAGADLFLYPSLYEGFGLPPLEAWAVGTPFLVSQGSSLDEIVPDRSWQFSPTEVEALSLRLRHWSGPGEALPPLGEEFYEAAAVARYEALILAELD